MTTIVSADRRAPGSMHRQLQLPTLAYQLTLPIQLLTGVADFKRERAAMMSSRRPAPDRAAIVCKAHRRE